MKDEICKAYVMAAIGEIDRQNTLAAQSPKMIDRIDPQAPMFQRLVEMQAVGVAAAIQKALEARPIARGFKGK
jgi:hypothetical protein